MKSIKDYALHIVTGTLGLGFSVIGAIGLTGVMEFTAEVAVLQERQARDHQTLSVLASDTESLIGWTVEHESRLAPMLGDIVRVAGIQSEAAAVGTRLYILRAELLDIDRAILRQSSIANPTSDQKQSLVRCQEERLRVEAEIASYRSSLVLLQEQL